MQRPSKESASLVVEDDEDSREVLSLCFSNKAARACKARNRGGGDGGLKSSPSNLPDVIISRFGNADEDGYSLISRIRELPQNNVGGKVAAIALSAFATIDNKQKAFEVGFQKYNTKPFEPDL
jgi:CheY-like chemotaxis protein